MQSRCWKPLCTLIAIFGMAPLAGAQSPAWKVYFERISGWSDPAGVVVDSTGYAVTLEPARGLGMPRCSQIEQADLARLARNVSWLMENVKADEGVWRGQCRDDPEAKIYIQTQDQALPLRFPLDPNCREVEPPSALLELADQLLKLREQPLEQCRVAPATLRP